VVIVGEAGPVFGGFPLTVKSSPTATVDTFNANGPQVDNARIACPVRCRTATYPTARNEHPRMVNES